MIKRILLAATLAVLPVGAALADEPLPQNLVDDAEKVVAHMEKLAGLVTQSGGDCAALATAIDGYTAEHGTELGTLTTRLGEVTPEQEAALKARFDARTAAAGKSMLDGLVQCSEHAGVSEAFARLERHANPQAQAQPAASVAVDDAEVDKLVGHMEALGKVMNDNLADCAKMASGIEAFAEANRAEIATLSDKMAALPAEQQLQIEAKYKDRLEAAISAVMAGVTACGADPAVESAMKALDL